MFITGPSCLSETVSFPGGSLPSLLCSSIHLANKGGLHADYAPGKVLQTEDVAMSETGKLTCPGAVERRRGGVMSAERENKLGQENRHRQELAVLGWMVRKALVRR